MDVNDGHEHVWKAWEPWSLWSLYIDADAGRLVYERECRDCDGRRRDTVSLPAKEEL